MNNNYGTTPASLGFGESIATCFKKYFIFEGRAGLAEFWYFHLFQLILGTVATLIHPLMANVLFAILIIPMFSVGCRRLHDINKSGWWQFLVFTIIGIILLIIWFATDGVDKVTKSKKSSKYREVDIKEIKTSYEDNDLTEELEELQELYEDGTLSKAQFKMAKKKLLG